MTRELHQRILVVDDDPEIRRILVTALRQKALLIDEAADGAQALALLREHTYSVVLLDLLMPLASGFVVLDAIDENDVHAPIVLVVTGADRSLLDQLDSRKIHGVVRKPFDPHEIASVVAACSDIRGRGTFETMALATMMTGAPLIALLKL
jgi:DNA-binding response OmpR family regulator